MALEIPVIADLIARPRRIVKLSPAKKASIAAYESATALAVQSRKLSKISAVNVRKVMADAETAQNTAAQDFDLSALAGTISRWMDYITSDDERDDVANICSAYLRHEAGSLQKYRELTKIMSERQRRGW